jgi:endonuclease G
MRWIVCVVLLAGCRQHGIEHVRVTKPGDAPAMPESDDIEVAAAIDANCLMGAPVLRYNFGETTVVGRTGYALTHSNDLKIPLWVCEHVTADELEDGCTRGDWFRSDPQIPIRGRAKKSDYLRSGYDRGHMAPSEDFSASCDEMRDSFYLSNMAPQIGAGFNQHVWSYLEARTRGWVETYGEAWIVTGPVFVEDDEGLYCTATIGAGEVGVPAAFFKAVVVEDNGEHKALGFILENKRYSTKQADHADFSDYATTIDDVEARTGLDLFPGLPSNVEGRIEAAPPRPGEW